jgi:teichuronic acid exporter
LTVRSPFARQAAGAAWWSAIEVASRYGVQFLVTLVLARLLLPDDFGLIALLLIFTEVGLILVDSGYGVALIQRQHVDADDETTIFIFSSTVAVLITLVLAAVAPLAANFFHAASVAPLLRLVSLVLVFNGLGVVPNALLTMRMDFRTRTLAQLLASLTSGAVAIALAFQHFGVWSLAWQIVIAGAVRTVSLWLLSTWRPRGRFRMASLRSLGNFGSSMLISGLIYTFYLQTIPLLIGRLFDTRSLGYFSLAQNTQQAPASLIGSILTQAGFPVFAAVAVHPEKLLDALRRILRLSMFVFVPCMVGVAIIAKPLVLVIYGERWLPAAPLLSVLAVASALWPVHVLNQEAVKAQGRSDLFLRLTIAKIALATILAAGGSHWGILGIAWAALVSSVCSALINTYYSWKLLAYGALAQGRDQIATFLLAITAAPVGWIILHRLPVGLLGIALAILAAGAVYVGLAVVLRVQAIQDLRLFLYASWRDKRESA